MHGICYDFFFVTGQIYADNKAPSHLKSSVQGMMTFATYGIGMFIGSWVSGQVVSLYTLTENSHNWQQIWILPALASLVVLVIFFVFFNEKPAKAPSEDAPKTRAEPAQG